MLCIAGQPWLRNAVSMPLLLFRSGVNFVVQTGANVAMQRHFACLTAHVDRYGTLSTFQSMALRV
jgi:hypothetical protein